MSQEEFLNQNVFYGLTNLNDGFDSESIKYFSEADFEKILMRIQEHGLLILGIEPWFNGDFYGVICFDNNDSIIENYERYKKAFAKFKSQKKNLQYSASYHVPDNILNN